jgi:hypothetical protein
VREEKPSSKNTKRRKIKMTRTEAVEELRALAYDIYDTLKEMEDILREVAPEELERARVYWMAHIDGALLNLKGWMGGSLISLVDTLTILKEEEE